MQHILSSFLLRVQDACAVEQGSRQPSAGCRALADASGWWWESWSPRGKSTQMGTCLIKLIPTTDWTKAVKPKYLQPCKKPTLNFSNQQTTCGKCVIAVTSIFLTPSLNLFFPACERSRTGMWESICSGKHFGSLQAAMYYPWITVLSPHPSHS